MMKFRNPLDPIPVAPLGAAGLPGPLMVPPLPTDDRVIPPAPGLPVMPEIPMSPLDRRINGGMARFPITGRFSRYSRR